MAADGEQPYEEVEDYEEEAMDDGEAGGENVSSPGIIG